MGLKRFLKDPSDVADFGIRWVLEDGEQLTSSTWAESPAGAITIDSESFNALESTSIVWLSGGTENTSVILTNTVTTTGGRTLERSILVKVREL